eukprot:TRINITY_DN34010_c0_g1_i1.p1 TRINITY_DN34010_c0_g1~~TRINITY_DN34010_c0_g1_i1.p1  ORF type:complete len:312 (+),score=23.13 TRINITY_DN34010_c0_g1_i1:224-1159(+)
MSMEARCCGGGVAKMQCGGVTASLQSIGASGIVKQEAADSIGKALRGYGVLDNEEYLCVSGGRAPLVVVQLPTYFASPSPGIPLRISDYKYGGYNFRRAECMLNDSILWNNSTNARCDCCLGQRDSFKVIGLERIENKQIFERFKVHEARIADAIARSGTNLKPISSHHDWLQRLGDKNGLCHACNSVYLLHGTRRSHLDSICRHGLTTTYSLNGTDGMYGKGLYFTDSSCKAFQYAGLAGCILVCRVVLGRMEVLKQEDGRRVFAPSSYDSCMAASNYTRRRGDAQVHNEYIVFQDEACYPEFVIHVETQ